MRLAFHRVIRLRCSNANVFSKEHFLFLEVRQLDGVAKLSLFFGLSVCFSFLLLRFNSWVNVTVYATAGIKGWSAKLYNIP